MADHCNNCARVNGGQYNFHDSHAYFNTFERRIRARVCHTRELYDNHEYDQPDPNDIPEHMAVPEVQDRYSNARSDNCSHDWLSD